MSNHKDLGIRTTLYWFFAAVLGEACLGLAGSFALRKPPVAAFFAFTGLLLFFSMPGWGWSLWMEIIYGTMEKKKELKRVNLDVFLAMSLGIKALFWFLINSLQFSIVTAAITVPLYFAAGPIQASLVGGLLSSTIGILIIPVVMAHMAMPVQWKAWVAPIMWKVSVKNIRPLLQWWIMAVVTCSASVVLMVITLAIVYYYALPVVDGLGQKIVLPEGITLPNQKISAVVAYVIIGGIVLLQILQFAFAGFASVFIMRTHGLFVRAFKRNLELITEVRKPKYVSKAEIAAKRIAEKEAKQHKKKLAKKKKKSK